MKNTTQWTDHVCKQHDWAWTNFEKDQLQEKNELKEAERLQKAMEQQIDNVHEQMVEIQVLKI